MSERNSFSNLGHETKFRDFEGYLHACRNVETISQKPKKHTKSFHSVSAFLRVKNVGTTDIFSFTAQNWCFVCCRQWWGHVAKKMSGFYKISSKCTSFINICLFITNSQLHLRLQNRPRQSQRRAWIHCRWLRRRRNLCHQSQYRPWCL